MSDILNDFNSKTNISYQAYIDTKSFPLYELSNLSDRYHIKKKGSFLYINKDTFDLSTMSINDVFTLILDTTDIVITIYTENSSSFLSNTSLFLCDFNTNLTKVVSITKTSTNIKSIYTYQDKYLSTYKLKNFYVLDNYMNNIDYRIEDDYLQASFIDYAKLYLNYNATTFKGRALEEYPMTNMNQYYLTLEGI